MQLKTIKSFLSQLGLALASASAVFGVARHVEPVFLGRQPAVQKLLEPQVRPAIVSPAASDSVMERPTFDEDRRRFAEDLFATGKVTEERAEELATYAVREAYKRDVPPALVFGVMMVENDEFKSTARSNMGAVGLMQVSPRVWVKPLEKYFGRNLRNDETNIKYGVYILSALVHENRSSKGVDVTLRKGLLRYNGCVRGKNTPNCHRYPDLVKRRIEKYARSQCSAVGYRGCVTSPMQVALVDRAVRRSAAARRMSRSQAD